MDRAPSQPSKEHAAAGIHGALDLSRLPELLMQSPTPILVMTGQDHTFSLINSAFVRILRRSSSDLLLGRPAREAVPEAVGQGFIDLLDGVYRTGKPFVGHKIPALLENEETGASEEAFFDFVYQPLLDAQHKIIGVLAQATDVTEYVLSLQRAEERETALKLEWEQLDAMYRSAPVGFALYEPKDFRMIHLNQKFAEMLDMRKEDLLGKSVLDFAGNIDGVRKRFQTVADGGSINNLVIEGELESQPGRFRSWLINYAPIYGADGTVTAISTVSLDITAQKRAEVALIQSEKLSAVGRLASSIAHEINNPLESVTNLIYLTQMTATDPEQQRYLDMAEQELRRVSNIATQTLRFHKQLSRPTAIGCSALFKSVLSVYEGRLKNSHIDVQVREHGERTVTCMEGEIRQVLNNLVGNAIDSMASAANGGRLTLSSREGTDWRTGRRGLVLTVSDTGTGMDAKTRAKVFEAFFTTKGIGGTGLGLWISAEIVQRHGGRLLLRSTKSSERHGTVVSLFLPFDHLGMSAT